MGEKDWLKLNLEYKIKNKPILRVKSLDRTTTSHLLYTGGAIIKLIIKRFSLKGAALYGGGYIVGGLAGEAVGKKIGEHIKREL